MNDYLTPEHPDAFLDWPKQEPPTKWYPERTIECPMCHGRGGWNLRVNASRLPNTQQNNAENRHLFCHFRAGCNQCNGYGWVEPGLDAECIHEFSRELSVRECDERKIYHAGRCWHVYQCSKCGKTLSHDSSD